MDRDNRPIRSTDGKVHQIIDGRVVVEFAVTEAPNTPPRQPAIVISLRCGQVISSASFTPQQAFAMAAMIERAAERAETGGVHG